MKKQFSIIICCYNSATTIYKCLNSLLCQNIGFDFFEVLIVNDGSTDNTLDFITQFKNENKDVDIKITTQKNRGLSNSRNYALSQSSSKYVLFLDSDDKFSNNFLNELLNFINNDEYDVIPFLRRTYKDGVLIKENFKKLGFANIYVKPRNLIVGAQYYCYNLSFLKTNKLEFIENIIHEDIPFLVTVLLKVKKFKFFDFKGYIRFIHENSLSKRNTLKRVESYFFISKMLFGLKRKYNNDNKRNIFIDYFGTLVFFNALSCLPSINIDERLKNKINENPWLKNPIEAKSLKRKIQFLIIKILPSRLFLYFLKRVYG